MKKARPMKKVLLTTIILIILLLTPTSTFAQGMPAPSAVEGMGTQSAISSDDHTAREEAEGKEIWEKLQAKQLECKNLTNDNYAALGEYFMGQMVGSSHEAMNNMMVQMMGQQGEEQMHIAMGKRLSGCQPEAEFPQAGVGFMPMMWMGNFGQNPMGWFGFSSWAVTLTLVAWLVVGILAIIWLLKQIRKK